LIIIIIIIIMIFNKNCSSSSSVHHHHHHYLFDDGSLNLDIHITLSLKYFLILSDHKSFDLNHIIFANVILSSLLSPL